MEAARCVWVCLQRYAKVLSDGQHVPEMLCRGFGTVRFSTKEEADAAAEKLNNTQIGGRTVTVRIDRFA